VTAATARGQPDLRRGEWISWRLMDIIMGYIYIMGYYNKIFNGIFDGIFYGINVSEEMSKTTHTYGLMVN